ncbi:MAG: cytochrome c oxidase subunit 3 [Planctomycetota bacterium]
MSTITPSDLPNSPPPTGPGFTEPVDPVHGHHWRSLDDEQDGAKFGMWIFLATEVLLFSGFFCAYAVFRMWYPENWHEASRYYLNWKIGAFNTVVLLISSFTVVMAIRYAQLKKRMWCLFHLTITQICALAFLFIKIVWEYIPKIKKGELVGGHYNYIGGHAHLGHGEATAHGVAAAAGHDAGHTGEYAAHAAEDALKYAGGPEWSKNLPDIPLPAVFDTGYHSFEPGAHDQVFLGIYWVTTATHGVHVLIGVFLFAWIMWKAWKWQYGPKNVTSLENAGLYWHIVDIIWIFVFPLMYLV